MGLWVGWKSTWIRLVPRLRIEVGVSSSIAHGLFPFDNSFNLNGQGQYSDHHLGVCLLRQSPAHRMYVSPVPRSWMYLGDLISFISRLYNKALYRSHNICQQIITPITHARYLHPPGSFNKLSACYQVLVIIG